MPDLDFVAAPYRLARGFAVPAETAPAEVGNFLVRERVRKILELAVPGACRFVPTAEKKSGKPINEWWLAVPARLVDMPGLPLRDGKRLRCSQCGEPRLGYYPMKPIPGQPHAYRYAGLDNCDCRGLDVFKTKHWFAIDTLENLFAGAVEYEAKGGFKADWKNFGGRIGVPPPPHPERWTRVRIGRDLFFSVRLEQLLKKAKVKGQLVRSSGFDEAKATPADTAWIDEKLALLADVGLIEAHPASPAKKSGGADSWFATYLKKNAAKKPPAKVDFAAIEKTQKFTLPEEYKAFVLTVGSKAFKNVMQIDGFTARILPPKKLDFTDYRREKWKGLSVKSGVDGVAFAETDHGDVFVFDMSKKSGATVFWYDHEQNTVEPFAASFAECIKRFDQKD